MAGTRTSALMFWAGLASILKITSRVTMRLIFIGSEDYRLRSVFLTRQFLPRRGTLPLRVSGLWFARRARFCTLSVLIFLGFSQQMSRFGLQRSTTKAAS